MSAASTPIASHAQEATLLPASHTAYHLAKQYCQGSDVLAVAGGPSAGLAYLAASARRVLCGVVDIDPRDVATAASAAVHNIELLELEPGCLPLDDDSFDVVLCFEAFRHLPSPPRFIREAKRVLRPGGHLLVCAENADRQAGGPAGHSGFLASDLARLLVHGGFYPKLFGAPSSSKDDRKRHTSRAVHSLTWPLKVVSKTAGNDLPNRVLPWPAATSATGLSLVELSGKPGEQRFSMLYAVAAVDKWPAQGVAA